MSNPDDSVGTNGAYGGRTSVNAFNDVLGGFSRGVLSGWACVPSTGMKVNIGGIAGTRDVAIAEDDNGNKTTINNISELPIELTISAAPGANTRIDAIVAYVDNPPEGTTTDVDNPGACGIIVVAGTASATPSVPNDSAIRTAITADGATGASAYYAILATVTVSNGTTDITSNLISLYESAVSPAVQYSTTEQAVGKWVDGKIIYRKTLYISSFPNDTETSLGNLLPANILITKIEGTASAGTGVIAINGYRPKSTANTVGIRADQTTGQVLVAASFNATSYSGYATFEYTKN